MVLTRRANPATQELAKIAAQTSRPEVYFALLGAFARANGLVDLAQEADAALRGEPFAAPIPAVQQGRTFVRNDPRVAKEIARLLRATKKQMRQSPRQAVRSGNTIYDRNLAWFAAILAERPQHPIPGGALGRTDDLDQRLAPQPREPLDHFELVDWIAATRLLDSGQAELAGKHG